MKPITDNTSARKSAGMHGAPLTVSDLGGILRQGVTLLRIIGIVLTLYLTSKFLLWVRRHARPK